ncbi:stage III sporulation protein AA [Clostridium baratii]|uniref:stage III sporulation protein AA n=1 Tax=Clostridium baratii TaxID=1561 RepID=UPI0009A447C5|nr:stage III sporulation protein AA [Clostridium baratii]OPF51587.1 stage III sporulation protein AA [Clostridium baratii]OPF55342.1 stage III sporulation protein AA [Clostridium baratii]OPF57625.1 stage III sporulation protein AA [Clostridium baratii]OPF60277.1 stage III sporulation protein AA [Clostridium baratii]
MDKDGRYFNIFPPKIISMLSRYKDDGIQEIRLKINKPIIIYTNKKEIVLYYNITKEDIKYILQRISNYSIYAYEEEIKQGFITLKGGHRIGIAGECVMENNKVKTIKNIASINIRICKEILGCSKKILKYIMENDVVKNTLIISPPKCGKTTILRDVARVISTGDKSLNLSGKKVTIIDERSEIGASYLGVPQMDLGIRTDVLDNCLKTEGMLMAIRSLSPEVLICDEIGTSEDIKALNTAFNSGVNVVVTVHGSNLEDIKARNVFNELFGLGIIERVIVLSSRHGVGTVENIYSVNKEGGILCLG